MEEALEEIEEENEDTPLEDLLESDEEKE